jgi:hypothetical protein
MINNRSSSNPDVKRRNGGGSEKLRRHRKQEEDEAEADEPESGQARLRNPGSILKRRRTADDEVDRIEICAAPVSKNSAASNSGL